jgi:hypothetical protein
MSVWCQKEKCLGVKAKADCKSDRIQLADWRWRIVTSRLRAKDGFAMSIGRL